MLSTQNTPRNLSKETQFAKHLIVIYMHIMKHGNAFYRYCFLLFFRRGTDCFPFYLVPVTVE